MAKSYQDRDRVVPLGKLKDYKVSKGDTDVRKWEMVASDGRTVGNVHDLLVDLRSEKVRYLDVRLKKGTVDSDRETHVLVPMANARFHEDDKRVYVEGIDYDDFARLPEYGHEPLTREQEEFLRQRMEGPTPPPPAGPAQQPPEPSARQDAPPAREPPPSPPHPPPPENPPPPESPPPGQQERDRDW
ncbi:MAG: PRC-barrel domain-containing protein [Longimicrobiaceae bacterium]